VLRLRDWHENLKELKAEHELSWINRLEEVEKYKKEAKRCKNEANRYNNEAEKCRDEAEEYTFKLCGQTDKFRSVERKYQIALVYTWVMLMWLLDVIK
jgi:uncharacterized coiled-coil DUF342 family protein